MPQPCNAAATDVQGLSKVEVVSINHAGNQEMPPFLKMPFEVRNQIYEYLLSTKHTKVDFLDEEPGYDAGRPERARRIYHFHPAILAVNRQINYEAGQTLRENLFVKLTTNVLQDNHGVGLEVNGLPLVAEYDLASRVTYFSCEITMEVDAEAIGLEENDGELESVERDDCFSILMFAGDDMNTFSRVLLRSVPPCRLSIAITAVAPITANIRKLLEPLRRLHSQSSVTITGQVSAEYKFNLIAAMLKQAPDEDTTVQEVQDTMEQGDQAADVKDYVTAIVEYQKALEYNNDGCSGYDADRITLQRGKFNGQTLRAVFIRTLFALNTKLATAYLKLDNHSRAHAWIARALMQIDAFKQVAGASPMGAPYANVYSIAARASEGLGLVERAVVEMEEAVRLDPKDSSLNTELARLKRKT